MAYTVDPVCYLAEWKEKVKEQHQLQLDTSKNLENIKIVDWPGEWLDNEILDLFNAMQWRMPDKG